MAERRDKVSAKSSRPGKDIPIRRRCQLLGLSRSSYYYRPKGISVKEDELMKLIDRQYLITPFYGARKMAIYLRSLGHQINRKRVRRLMRLMGLKAIYRRPWTSKPALGNKVYPYLLNGIQITRPNQVWAADITYIPMQHGFLYLVAIIDWYSRYVLVWRLSNTLDTDFCVAALEESFNHGKPEIFNTDQGSQFTSEAFIHLLEQHNIRISMDGKGSYNDNLFVERLWRTVKYEEVYLKAYQNGKDARFSLDRYFRFYNTQRPHQSLDYRTPAEVYTSELTLTNGGMLQSPVITAGFHLIPTPILS